MTGKFCIEQKRPDGTWTRDVADAPFFEQQMPKWAVDHNLGELRTRAATRDREWRAVPCDDHEFLHE